MNGWASAGKLGTRATKQAAKEGSTAKARCDVCMHAALVKENLICVRLTLRSRLSFEPVVNRT